MRKTVIGIFDVYSKAEEVVQELELIGIDGAEVEVISDADADVRTRGIVSSADEGRKEGVGEKIAHFFHSSNNAGKHHAGKNETTDYAKEQEYNSGRTIVIVRTSNERGADRAADILRSHGAEDGGPTQEWENEVPESNTLKPLDAPLSGMGTPDATTGSDATDLEARGKVLRVPGSK
ncbi:MAG: hypothetical protein ACRD4S_14910 [Candidatus Acidiferrales bacterium]